MTLDDYILQHIDPEPDYLYRLWRATNIHMLHGRMASGHLQGRLLKMLVTMIRPKNILEVGTFSGYSAICMAEGLEEGGLVYTFEINDEQEDFTRPWIENSPVADKILMVISAPIARPTKWRFPYCVQVVLSWLTTRCGMAMWLMLPTIVTHRRRVSRPLMIMCFATSVSNVLSCL